MRHSPGTLTASLLTPPGRGAVAVIRVYDSADSEQQRALSFAIDPCFVAVNGRTILDQPINRLCYGDWEADGTREDVVVCRTTAATVEISCHGGRVAVARIFDSLERVGVTIEDWQAQAAGISSEFEAETTEALSLATTLRAASILLDQASGTLQDCLVEMLTLEPGELAVRLESLLAHSRFGQHLTEPWRVVLAGRPNVGKSTLINSLLGYTRAIVFDQPGTTRDVVTGRTAFDGWPFELADTAGIRTTDDELEQAGINRARRTVQTADLVCLLLDTSRPATPEDRILLDEFSNGPCEFPVITVAHKADLLNQWDEQLPGHALRVSSTTGDGVQELIALIVKTLISSVPPVGTPVPVSSRQTAWLKKARLELSSGNYDESIVAIQKCLGGSPVDFDPVEESD